MARKRYRPAAARKGIRPAAPWRVYTLAGALLLFMVGAGVVSQLLSAAASPEPAAVPAAPTAPAATNRAGASPGSSEANSARTLNLYGGGMRPLVEERDGVQTLNIYGPGGRIIAQLVRDGQGSEEVRYLLTDHLGSTRVVVDAEGNAVARYEYGPHGETTVGGVAGAEVEYRYTGHPYDEGQEVYETPARGYDPTLGRFLSVDPQRETASPYTYVTNNPVLYKDPTGKARVGTVVTEQVLSLAKELVGETSEFESTYRFMSEKMEPTVGKFFKRLVKFYNQDDMTYFRFKNLVKQADDDHALRKAFRMLRRADPDTPRMKMKERHDIMSNLDEFHRLMQREEAYYELKSPGVKVFEGNEEAYYRSSLAMTFLRDTDGSAPGEKKGYGNCGEVSMCIGGRIAETDPKVNVEGFSPGGGINHGFIVVGRDPKTDSSKPMTWNDSAIIVDGWLGRVEQANQYYAQGKDLKYFNIEIPPELEFNFE